MKALLKRGVTLLELIVVILILSILSTIAVGIYTREVQRAKIVRTRAEIRTLEVAINRYQIDCGSFPPSSSGTVLAPGNLDQLSPFQGNGYMQACVRGSLNGNASSPLSKLWFGPYIDWDENRLGTLAGTALTPGLSRAAVQFIDPFGGPYHFVQNEEYATFGGTMLPATDPYFAVETYYNPATFQLISFGPNGQTAAGANNVGTEEDDITNFRGPDIL